MSNDTARRVANAIIGVSLVAGAYVVLSRPRLRRLAWNLALAGLTGTLPAWLDREVRQAWAESGQQMR